MDSLLVAIVIACSELLSALSSILLAHTLKKRLDPVVALILSWSIFSFLTVSFLKLDGIDVTKLNFPISTRISFFILVLILLVVCIICAVFFLPRILDRESIRKVYHMLGGFGIISCMFFSKEWTIILLSAFCCFLMFLEWLRHQTGKIPDIIRDALEPSMREEERETIPFALIFFILSSLILMICFDVILTSVGIASIAFGDSFANIIGRKFGKHKWVWNQKKSVEGTLAGTTALASVFLAIDINWLSAPPLGFLIMVFESLQLGIKDNLILPLVAIIFFTLFRDLTNAFGVIAIRVVFLLTLCILLVIGFLQIRK